MEIPRTLATVLQDLMRLLGMKDGQKSKSWKTQPPLKLRFVGFPFLDASHQSNPPTQEGHGHGGVWGATCQSAGPWTHPCSPAMRTPNLQ